MAAKKGSGGVDAGRLKSLIQRIEKLEEEKQALAGDIKEVFSEAKSAGYDVKIIRQVIRIRKMDKADRAEQDELLDLYLNAVGE
ncbi:MAG: DUF2312 domain-containing protein [Alphaproteobacteria bacterium]|nr:DUF2312 domain-containing protein [Alphaproteobacteria bacterium]MCC7048036.1 DUF2312 domain-containing protein [Alphaproteobacteria bacterium]